MQQQKQQKTPIFCVFALLNLVGAQPTIFFCLCNSRLISDYMVLPVSVCFITTRRKVNATKWKIRTDYKEKHANWQKKPAEKNIQSNPIQ